MRRAIILCLGVLLCGVAGRGQTTTNVTATLVDPSGTSWSNASWTANVISTGQPPVTVPDFNVFPTSYSGTADANGTFAVAVQRVANIFPAGATWQFCVVSAVTFTQSFCANVAVGNSGQSSQDVSAQIGAVLQVPTITGGPAIRAYTDAEVTAFPGAQYFNVKMLSFRCFGNAWSTCGGGGGGGVASINTVAGAFTFQGAGVACVGTTCTVGGGGSGIGSIAWTLPSFLTASPATLTASGTQTFGLATQAVNAIFAGPSSGGAAAPTFRALVVADIPALPYDPSGAAAAAQAASAQKSANLSDLASKAAALSNLFANPAAGTYAIVCASSTSCAPGAAAPGGVTSFNTRTGAVVPTTGDYTAAQVGALPSSTTFVGTFKGRSGVVVPASDDYTAAQVTNALDLSNTGTQTLSGGLIVPAIRIPSILSANVLGTDASGNIQASPSTFVNSFKGRTGAVVPVSGDYTAAQVGALASSTIFVGTFNTRSGTVVPASGDYTAAMVTNALDKSTLALQVMTASLQVPDVQSLSIENSNTISTNSLVVTANALFSGHLLSNGTAPTVTVGSGAGGGSAAATMATGSTDIRGVINLTTGTTPVAGSDLFVVTFHTGYLALPVVVLQDMGGGTTGTIPAYVLTLIGSGGTSSGFSVRSRNALTATNPGYQIAYHVIG